MPRPWRALGPWFRPSDRRRGAIDAWQTIVLATLLSYVSGFILGVLSVMRSRRAGSWAAFRLIWIGEAVSIGVMELAMNLVDYRMGGMNAAAILSWTFVRGLAFASRRASSPPGGSIIDC